MASRITEVQLITWWRWATHVTTSYTSLSLSLSLFLSLSLTHTHMHTHTHIHTHTSTSLPYSQAKTRLGTEKKKIPPSNHFFAFISPFLIIFSVLFGAERALGCKHSMLLSKNVLWQQPCHVWIFQCWQRQEIHRANEIHTFPSIQETGTATEL